MDLLKSLLAMVLGKDWVITLLGYVVGLSIFSATYFGSSHPEPGWYLVAAGFTALGRLAAQEKSKRDPPVNLVK